MNKFIKSFLQLIISTSTATLEVPSLRHCINQEKHRFYDVNFVFTSFCDKKIKQTKVSQLCSFSYVRPVINIWFKVFEIF